MWWIGLSLRWLLLLLSTGSRKLQLKGPKAQGLQCALVVSHRLGSCGSWALEHRLRIVVHGLSQSEICGIVPDKGWNLCLLHWQADSYLLHHGGSPIKSY